MFKILSSRNWVIRDEELRASSYKNPRNLSNFEISVSIFIYFSLSLLFPRSISLRLASRRPTVALQLTTLCSFLWISHFNSPLSLFSILTAATIKNRNWETKKMQESCETWNESDESGKEKERKGREGRCRWVLSLYRQADRQRLWSFLLSFTLSTVNRFA